MSNKIATLFHSSKHLVNSELLPPSLSCPFCGSDKRRNVSLIQKDPDVSLLECLDCQAASASRIPTPDALDRYYGDYYTTNASTKTFERITFQGTDRFGKHLVKRLVKHLSASSVNILDYGGGDGSVSLQVARQLLKNGFDKIDITVIDYNDNLVKSDNRCISLRHQVSLDNVAPLYDFVIASAIIEHLPEPKMILLNLLNVVKEHGIFYARTPHISPLIKLLSRFGTNIDFTFPGHIHDLGQNFWENFFKKKLYTSRFSIIESRPSLVETSFKDSFLRTFAAYLFKAPWYVIGKRYSLVGGWEIFVQKNHTSS